MWCLLILLLIIFGGGAIQGKSSFKWSCQQLKQNRMQEVNIKLLLCTFRQKALRALNERLQKLEQTKKLAITRWTWGKGGRESCESSECCGWSTRDSCGSSYSETHWGSAKQLKCTYVTQIEEYRLTLTLVCIMQVHSWRTTDMPLENKYCPFSCQSVVVPNKINLGKVSLTS